MDICPDPDLSPQPMYIPTLSPQVPPRMSPGTTAAAPAKALKALAGSPPAPLQGAPRPTAAD